MYHSCMSYRSLASGFAAREVFPHFPRRAPAEFARVVAACLDPELVKRPTFVQVRGRVGWVFAWMVVCRKTSGALCEDVCVALPTPVDHSSVCRTCT
jgi:hypothetical protein